MSAQPFATFLRQLLLVPCAATFALLCPPARAGEIYGQVGLPGVGLGFAQPINSNFGLRADWVTLGKRSKTQTEEGISYAGKLDSRRLALLADMFPMGGSFRFTAGITSNKYQLALDASGTGRTITVGNNSYTLTADDGYNVLIKFPSSTPYLGLGWGHGQDSGVRFSADIGAMIGKAKLTSTGRGVFANGQGQADVDAELAKLSDGVGKIRFVPQLSVSIGYSF
jgi:hypothetical protein